MAASEDDAWLLDGVDQFFKSQIWQMPVMGFIDQKCLVFDNEEENKLAYTEIHKEYQKLVELMLENFVNDIGVTSEDFITACKEHAYQCNASTMSFFEQIEAAQDFEIFKRMMIKQNVELELQALHILQARHGVVPGIMVASQEVTEENSQDAAPDNEEERILNEILRKSKEEYDALKKQGRDNDRETESRMGQALANSREEKERLQREKDKEEDLLAKALKMSIESAPISSSGLPPVPQTSKISSSSRSNSKVHTSSSTPTASVSKPTVTTSKPAVVAAASGKQVSGAEAAANWLSSAKAEAATETSRQSLGRDTAASEASEHKKREEYLKRQRDLLIEMKRKERERHFDRETAPKSKAPSRPKSARAARQAMAGEVKTDESKAEQEKKLRMRLALADRLKKEVIYDQ